MTLLEAITEMHALYPDRYVSVDVAVGWHCPKYAESGPEVTVNCYVEGIGHLTWGVSSIDAAMTIVRARATGSDGSELAITDPVLAAQRAT